MAGVNRPSSPLVNQRRFVTTLVILNRCTRDSRCVCLMQRKSFLDMQKLQLTNHLVVVLPDVNCSVSKLTTQALRDTHYLQWLQTITDLLRQSG